MQIEPGSKNTQTSGTAVDFFRRLQTRMAGGFAERKEERLAGAAYVTGSGFPAQSSVAPEDLIQFGF
jgi:hypothetical protein